MPAITTAQPGWWTEYRGYRFPIVAWGGDEYDGLYAVYVMREGLQKAVTREHTIVYEPENWPHGG
jgi:hypothetical protein